MDVCIKQHLQATFEAQFMKKLSNTETELKKSVAYKKTCITPLRTVLLGILSIFQAAIFQNSCNDKSCPIGAFCYWFRQIFSHGTNLRKKCHLV